MIRFANITDHDLLVEKTERWVVTHQNLDATLEEAMCVVAQADRMEDLAKNAMDEAQERQDSLNFTGDADPDGPPFAWVLLWGGQYFNLYGEFVPEPPRRWGYVMWDKARWEDLGTEAQELFRKQWEMDPVAVKSIQDLYDLTPPLLGTGR